MELSKDGAAFLRGHEGFVPRHYLDPVGVGTIGIGFTWRSDAFREWWAQNKPGVEFGPGATITREEAEDALIYLCRHEYGAAVNFPRPQEAAAARLRWHRLASLQPR